jgi:hypothetical protein
MHRPRMTSLVNAKFIRKAHEISSSANFPLELTETEFEVFHRCHFYPHRLAEI